MMQQSSGQGSSLQPSRHVRPWHDFPGLVIGNLGNPIDLEPPIGWQGFTPAIEVQPAIPADQLLGADMVIRQVPQFIQLRDVKLIGQPALLLPKHAGELDLQSQSANDLAEKTH